MAGLMARVRSRRRSGRARAHPGGREATDRVTHADDSGRKSNEDLDSSIAPWPCSEKALVPPGGRDVASRTDDPYRARIEGRTPSLVGGKPA